jgi:Recombination endonuclease VII
MQPEDKKLRHLERRRRRYAEDAVFRERILQSNRQYWLANQGSIKAQRRHKWATDADYRLKARLRWRPVIARKSKLKRLYGLSLKDYAALLERQNGLCLICKRKPKDVLCVDHCHLTRLVRELLCRKCNTGLGCFDDDPRLLIAAAKYLQSHRSLEHGQECRSPTIPS